MIREVPDSWRQAIERLVKDAPPISPARRDRLGALLRPTVVPVKAKTRRRRRSAA